MSSRTYSNSSSDALPLIRLNHSQGWGAALFWFFVFFTFVYVLLFSIRPSWVRRAGLDKNSVDNIDYPKLLWISALIALLVLLLVYVMQRCWAPVA